MLLLATTGAGVMAMTAPAGADSGIRTVSARGALRDLATTSDSTDGASAQLVGIEVEGKGSRFVLIVTGLDLGDAGTTHGAHVHTGPCVAGQPATAGPHYNTGGSTGPTDTNHEVWLDFTVSSAGTGVGKTSVPFTIPSGVAHSVVVHKSATQANGSAGPRLACLPVRF